MPSPFDERGFVARLTMWSDDIFHKVPFEFDVEMTPTVTGSLNTVGHIRCSGSGTKDNLASKALTGLNDRAYLFLLNQSIYPNEWVKVGLCASHGTDSASGDWFAVLGPREWLFIPISDMQDVDLEANSGNPNVEYFLFSQRD